MLYWGRYWYQTEYARLFLVGWDGVEALFTNKILFWIVTDSPVVFTWAQSLISKHGYMPTILCMIMYHMISTICQSTYTFFIMKGAAHTPCLSLFWSLCSLPKFPLNEDLSNRHGGRWFPTVAVVLLNNITQNLQTTECYLSIKQGSSFQEISNNVKDSLVVLVTKCKWQ